MHALSEGLKRRQDKKEEEPRPTFSAAEESQEDKIRERANKANNQWNPKDEQDADDTEKWRESIVWKGTLLSLKCSEYSTW